MSIDKTTIINWALTDIGAGPMFSVDDDSDLAMQIANTWGRTVDHVFGMHDWTFLCVTARLRRLADPLDNGWKYAYDLPSPRLSNPLAYRCGPRRSDHVIRDFTLEQDKFCCMEPQAWAVYKTYKDPDYWDPAFRSAFVVALAGYLAIPVWQDDNLQNEKLQQAFGTPSQQGTGGMIGRLMAQDKASRPVGEESLLSEDPLTSVRPTGATRHVPWHGSW
ncbi:MULTISPECIES: hypothetical protein [unclassified Rhizobium]|uniref:hypothetical protein n=1 Tax=unclassified Rhizobium TaxID=2613769 RepID=UPI001618E2F7|nr:MULTISPECIES: hypothetical protein [unclassified Rhizobium]MBB3385987.1 hypothetical protein [Rhizobium sp. BK098]MBB3617835.1 hypothetical protein [Rhizobium sp. BK609]MBB3683349.1 hypothetical protein [Rhizobium sp. BK612]